MKALCLILVFGLVGCKEASSPSARAAETGIVEPEFESTLDPSQFVGLAFQHQPSGYKFRIELDGSAYVAKSYTPEGVARHCQITWTTPADQSELTIDLFQCLEKPTPFTGSYLQIFAWDYGAITFQKAGADLYRCNPNCAVVLKAIEPAEFDGWVL